MPAKLTLSVACYLLCAGQVNGGTQLDPRLEQLLRGWEARTQNMTSLRCEFRRRVRQQAYPDDIEEYGRAVYVKPNRGRMDLYRRVRDNKGREKLQRSEIYICDGNVIHQYVFETKEYIRHILPGKTAGEDAARTALPFLFGISAREIRQRFQLRLYKETDEYAWIQILPRYEEDKRDFSEVKLVLSKKTFLPRAVLVKEPIGDQYLYDITTLEINPTPPVSERDLQPLRPPRDWQVYISRMDRNRRSGVRAPGVQQPR